MPTSEVITEEVYLTAKSYLYLLLNDEECIKYYCAPFLITSIFECLIVILFYDYYSEQGITNFIIDSKETRVVCGDTLFRKLRNTIAHSPYYHDDILDLCYELKKRRIIRKLFKQANIDLKYVSKVNEYLDNYIDFLENILSTNNYSESLDTENNIRTKASKLVRPELLDEFLKTLGNQDISDEALEFYAKIFNQSR